jgi:adenine-specific DNA methylase
MTYHDELHVEGMLSSMVYGSVMVTRHMDSMTSVCAWSDENGAVQSFFSRPASRDSWNDFCNGVGMKLSPQRKVTR